MLRVYDIRVVHTVVPVADAPEVSGFAGQLKAFLDEMSPEERLDLVSRKDSPLNKGELGL